MTWAAHACGSSTHRYASIVFYVLFAIQVLGVVLVIAVPTAYKAIAFAWLVFTTVHGVLVFISSTVFLIQLLRNGSSAFENFSFVRKMTSVIYLLALSIFYLHICSGGTAFIVPRDVQDMSRSVMRLDFLLTSVYASVGILSSVGYGDIIPVVWYARLIILPNFMFTFLANAMIFSAFTRFYAKSERALKASQYRARSDQYGVVYDAHE